MKTKTERNNSKRKRTQVSSIHDQHSLSGARVRWGWTGFTSGSPHCPGSFSNRSSFRTGTATLVMLIWVIAAITATSFQPVFGQGDNQNRNRRMMMVKDLVRVDGADDNELEGIGIVAGLAGTGDQSSVLRAEMLRNKINRLVPSLNINPDDIGTGNTALVALNSTLPAFQKQNTKIDVSLSTIGDAESLEGGNLIGGYLKGPDQNVYAVAKGPVTTSGDHLTSGQIHEGARVIREIDHQWIKTDTFLVGRDKQGRPIHRKKRYVQLNLKTPNWNTAQQIANSLNAFLEKYTWARELLKQGNQNLAVAMDRSTILVEIPGMSRTSKNNRRSSGRRNDDRRRNESSVSEVKVLSTILEQPIEYSENQGYSLKHPKVTINTKSNTWAIQGNVIVTPVTVPVAGTEEMQAISIDEPQKLNKFLMNNQQFANLTNNDIVEILKSLHAADALNAEVILK